MDNEETLLQLYTDVVRPEWIDYNGHMTESRYLFAASETSDAFLRMIGADLDYVKSGLAITRPKATSATWARQNWAIN